MTRWTDDGPAGSPVPGADDALRRRRLRTMLVVVAAAALVVLVIVVVGRPGGGATDGRAAGTTTVPATSSAPATTSAAQASARAAAASTADPPADPADPAAQRELADVAAGLPEPVVLTSPAEWDRWAGARPTYPGDRDIDGCPVMASRLGDALGMRFSYWFGTLPQGPYGCYYAPVPLHYDGSPYPYLVAVGWLPDGTTEVTREGFLQNRGQACPWLDVPAAGDRAVLVRCEQPGRLEYILTVRDARGAGLWVLSGTAGDGEAHTAPDVLAAVIQGVTTNYG